MNEIKRVRRIDSKTFEPKMDIFLDDELITTLSFSNSEEVKRREFNEHDQLAYLLTVAIMRERGKQCPELDNIKFD